MGRKIVQARRVGDARYIRRWRWRLVAGGVVVVLLGALVAYLGQNYGWSGPVRDGEAAPPFVLDDHAGRRVGLADYLGRQPVVLLFYMTYG
jgi:hypothetical protein